MSLIALVGIIAGGVVFILVVFLIWKVLQNRNKSKGKRRSIDDKGRKVCYQDANKEDGVSGGNDLEAQQQ